MRGRAKSLPLAVASSRQNSNSNPPPPPPPPLSHLKLLHARLLRSGALAADPSAAADVAASAAAAGHLPYAFSLLRAARATFAWNSAVRALARGPRPASAVAAYRSMLHAGAAAPNNYTYPFLLAACARLLPDPAAGLAVHASLFHRGLESPDPFIRTSLASFYAAASDAAAARKVFDLSPQKDVTLWNALIKAYISCGRYADVLRVFRAMEGRGRVRADEVTMLGVVSACAHLGALEMGQWAHVYAARCGLRMTRNLGTALMNMYMKCGEVGSAKSVFCEMMEKDIRTWSIMIGGLAFNGLADQAMEFFLEMQRSGLDSDSVTLTAVLSACSHAGMVDEGRRIFDSIATEYRIEPTIEHYGCMVDLLGRAGKLEEALALIRSVSASADVALWGALLVACRVHNNVEMGEMVAREMLKLDPHHAGACVFLSNVYADSGNWGLAGEVRKSMKVQKIYKPPGSSAIELDGVIHEFLSGDNSHPQSGWIYSKLDEIGRILSLRGHKPATRWVTFDIDDEDKEVCISQHSEKLALAFGLINTRKGAVIRIVKNLRICEDCHSVMKVVSEAYDHVIVVRDRKRFHHFKNGSCSCRDYW